jgi:predicted DNA-binding protein with PD1-like motif
LLDTEAFKPFGSNVHAVISDKKGRTFGGKMDTEDPRYEIAIPEKDVIDIIRVLKREK